MSSTGPGRITDEELALLLREAAKSLLQGKDTHRVRTDLTAVDLEELGRLMIREARRRGRRPSPAGQN